MMVKRSEYLRQLQSWKDMQVIKVVTGIRRCGKSTLFEMYQKQLISQGVEESQIISINFEELEYEHLLDYRALYAYVKERLHKTKTTYVFFDEIQQVQDFQKAVDSLYVKKNVDVYITGSNAYLLSGELATLLSVFCYPEDTKLVVLSLLSTYFGGMILDRFIFGINIKRRVCIISKRLDDILDFILYELHSGATLYDGIGGFDGTIHREINAIVDKHEYLKLMDFIRETDPSAFVTVYSVSEMRYTPKRHIQKENKENKEEIAEKENTLANTK